MSAVFTVPNDSGLVALCPHCVEQRMSDPRAPELERLDVGVISGTCHDCGGGFCLCRGALSRCDVCPRKNSPVVVQRLTAYTFKVPEPAPTVPVLAEVGE